MRDTVCIRSAYGQSSSRHDAVVDHVRVEVIHEEEDDVRPRGDRSGAGDSDSACQRDSEADAESLSVDTHLVLVT